MKLKRIPGSKVLLNTDIHSKYPGKARIIEAIKTLYPIYKTIANKSFTRKFGMMKDPDILDVLTTIVSGIEESTFDNLNVTASIAYNNGYVCRLQFWPNIEQEYKSYIVGVDFLPKLKKANKILHDILVEAIRILGNNKIGVPGYDMWDEMYIEDLTHSVMSYEDTNDASREAELNMIDNYNKHFSNYCTILDDAGSVKKLESLLEEITVQVKVERDICKVARLAIEINDLPVDMHVIEEKALKDFGEHNNLEKDEFGNYLFEDGEPITPMRTIYFNWFSSDDAVQRILSYSGETTGNFGQALYTYNIDCRTPQEVNNASAEAEPEILFMEKLADIFISLDVESICNYCDGYLIETLNTV